MTMSVEQTAYIIAKDRYELLIAAVKALMQEHSALLDSDEGYEEYCLIEAGHRSLLGDYEACQELYAAKKALIAWGHEAVKTCKQYKQYQNEFAEMFSKVQRYPQMQERLLGLLLKINASSVKKVKAA